MHEHADVLLLGGDLTRCGGREEADCLARSLEAVRVPVVAVLGNHDHHQDEEAAITKTLEGVGVHMLEGTGIDLEVADGRVGIAGVKGFGGGFGRSALSAFGERETKAFAEHAHAVADRLREALLGLASSTRIALLHYAPVEDTIIGEPLPIYPFLGSYLLAEAVDSAGCTLAVHGHAHAGRERAPHPAACPCATSPAL